MTNEKLIKLSIVCNLPDMFVVKDMGRVWSITNYVENVLEACQLHLGFNPETQAFIYFDTTGFTTLVKIQDGKFTGFGKISRDQNTTIAKEKLKPEIDDIIYTIKLS